MILNKFSVKKSFTLEVVNSSSGATTWQFPDIPFLREKYITGIALSTNTYGTTSGKSNAGNGLPLNNNVSSFLTLVNNSGNQFIQNMPLDELICQSSQQNNNAVSSSNFIGTYNTNGLISFKPVNIVWTKCFVYFPVAQLSSSACIQFNVYYQDQK